MWPLLVFLFLFVAFLVFFVVIARKGRELRRNQPLPPPATEGHLEWLQDGARMRAKIVTPFYLGRSGESDISISAAEALFEVCIFYHNRRFAIQTLQGAGLLRVNGEEAIAGYLRDGDVLQIADRSFAFHCK